MTEQSEIWNVRGGGMTRKCHRYGLTVTGCSLHYDCKDCKGPEKEEKDAPKRQNKSRKKRTLQPHVEDSNVKKRTRKPRIRPIIGKTSGKKPKAVPKSTGGGRFRRRTRTPRQQRLGE